MKLSKPKALKNYLVFILLLVSFISFSQDVTVDQNIWGYEFKKGEQELNWRELLKETESDVDSYELIKRAQSQNILSSIFGFAGGALAGIPIGQAIGDGDTNWVLALVGGALITVAIPLSSRSSKNLKRGVSTYNSRTNTSFLKDFQPEVSLVGNINGLGLRLRF